MAKVTVYYFTEYNIVTDEKVRSPRPATLLPITLIQYDAQPPRSRRSHAMSA
jgi:hypothetical protein